MSDSIYRHEAIKIITSYNGTVDKSVAKRLLSQMPSAETECTCCEYRVGDLCCYSDVKTDMEAMEEVERE